MVQQEVVRASRTRTSEQHIRPLDVTVNRCTLDVQVAQALQNLMADGAACRTIKRARAPHNVLE